MRLSLALLLAALATPCAAQAPATCADEVDGVVEQVRAAIARYADADAAELDGYRRISYDFPGMGEHWISLRHAVQDRFDLSAPPILLYARRGDERVLVGAAFVALREPGEALPGPAALRHAWHVHNGTLDDEVLAGDHHAAHGDAAFAVMVLHVWTVSPLDGGPFDVQNWRLPWLREAVEPPSADTDAARALSLLSSLDYYRDVLRSPIPAADHDDLDAMLDAARSETAGAARPVTDAAALAILWRRLAVRIMERWPDARAVVERLNQDPRVHLSCAL